MRAKRLAAPARERGRLRGLRTANGFVSVGVAMALLVASIAALFGSANSRVLHEMLDGGAWLWNSATENILHANGLTGELDAQGARLENSEGDEVEVIQRADGLYLHNKTTGELYRIDEATMDSAGRQIGRGVKFVVAGSNAWYVNMGEGSVTPADPETLKSSGQTVELGDPVQQALGDSQEHLWGLTEGGQLVAVDEEVLVAHELDSTGSALWLSMLDGEPVIFDQESLTVEVVALDDVGAPRALPSGAGQSFWLAEELEGRVLWLSSKAGGKVVWVDVDSGDAGVVELPGTDGHDLGPPLVAGTSVYVLDHTDGVVARIDGDGRRLVERAVVSFEGEDEDGDGFRDVDVFVKDGMLWINDPDGQEALAIDQQGQPRRIQKTEEAIDELPDPEDDRPTPEEITRGPEEGPDDGGSVGDDDEEDEDDEGSGGGDQGSTTTTTVPADDSVEPGAPEMIEATPGDEEASLRWSPADDGGVAETWYVESDDDETWEVDGSATMILVRPLENDTEYQFRVRGENSAGMGEWSAWSDPVTPDDGIPGAPEPIDAEAGAGEISLSWDEPDNNGGPDIAEYDIGCTSSGDSASRPNEPAGSDPMSVTIGGLDPGSSYTCSVVARNEDDVEGPAGVSAATTPYGAPGSPSVQSVTPGDSQVTLNWSPGANNGLGANGITVEYEVTAGSRSTTVTSNVATLTGLTNWQQYTCSVTAQADTPDGLMESTPATAPCRPSAGLSAPAGLSWEDRGPWPDGSRHALRISWNSVPSAVGYQIVRRSDGYVWNYSSAGGDADVWTCSADALDVYAIDPDGNRGPGASVSVPVLNRAPVIPVSRYEWAVPHGNSYQEGDMWRYSVWGQNTVTPPAGSVPYDPDNQALSYDILGTPRWDDVNPMPSIGANEWKSGTGNQAHWIQWSPQNHTNSNGWTPRGSAPPGGFGNVHFGVIFGSGLGSGRTIIFEWTVTDSCGAGGGQGQTRVISA